MDNEDLLLRLEALKRSVHEISSAVNHLVDEVLNEHFSKSEKRDQRTEKPHRKPKESPEHQGECLHQGEERDRGTEPRETLSSRETQRDQTTPEVTLQFDLEQFINWMSYYVKSSGRAYTNASRPEIRGLVLTLLETHRFQPEEIKQHWIKEVSTSHTANPTAILERLFPPATPQAVQEHMKELKREFIRKVN